MKKYLHLAYCEQTHAQCQGFACDDHIDKKCTIVLNRAEYQPLIAEIDKQAKRNLGLACSKWAKRTGLDECECEGDEFIGLEWLETSEYDYGDHLTSHEETISLLQELLQRLKDK